MKRCYYIFIGLLIIQNIFVAGCSKTYEKPIVVQKTTDKSNPSKIEYDFDGFYGEVQYLLTHFKKYSDRVICVSLKDLKRIGLCTLIKKDLRGGVLLSIDVIIRTLT